LDRDELASLMEMLGGELGDSMVRCLATRYLRLSLLYVKNRGVFEILALVVLGRAIWMRMEVERSASMSSGRGTKIKP
jgi:hypothetical protein